MVCQAGLDLTTKTIVIRACSTDGTYENIKEELIRIMVDKEEKTNCLNREKSKEDHWKDGNDMFQYGEKEHINRICIQKKQECMYYGRIGHGEKDFREKNMVLEVPQDRTQRK